MSTKTNKRIKAREYARKHRMSLFQVIQKIQKGELAGETVEENGVRISYVYQNEAGTQTTASSGDIPGDRLPPAETADTATLLEEIRALRREIQHLRETIDRCCASAT